MRGTVCIGGFEIESQYIATELTAILSHAQGLLARIDKDTADTAVLKEFIICAYALHELMLAHEFNEFCDIFVFLQNALQIYEERNSPIDPDFRKILEQFLIFVNNFYDAIVSGIDPVILIEEKKVLCFLIKNISIIT
ncbi:MAG: hypothetical protein HQL25_01325 [Candidatus Omnitrophica bacterium]|nr:hypothetical protein [Candidatus Omnitrophota bacterium]